MKDSTFKRAMMVLGLIIAFEILMIVAYPMFNTHVDQLTIEETYFTDRFFRVQTDKVLLNLTAGEYGKLLEGRTYIVKWVDGIILDRILKFHEIGRPTS